MLFLAVKTERLFFFISNGIVFHNLIASLVHVFNLVFLTPGSTSFPLTKALVIMASLFAEYTLTKLFRKTSFMK